MPEQISLIDQILNAGRDSWMQIARETLDKCREPVQSSTPEAEALVYAMRSGELQACVAGLLEVLGPTLAVSAGRHAAGF
jgi:hypothetical protein